MSDRDKDAEILALRHQIRVLQRQLDGQKVLAAGRAPAEHDFARLKNRRVITKLRTDPAHATNLLRALPVLTNLEVVR